MAENRILLFSVKKRLKALTHLKQDPEEIGEYATCARA